MTKTIAGAVFALALAGCGNGQHEAVQLNQPVKSTMGTVVAAPHVSTGGRCSNEDWQDIFWSDATYTVPVGTLTCSCFQLQDMEGVQSPYITLAYEDTCDTR
jgi:hypothetical protein